MRDEQIVLSFQLLKLFNINCLIFIICIINSTSQVLINIRTDKDSL